MKIVIDHASGILKVQTFGQDIGGEEDAGFLETARDQVE